jgi:hypothetical protein
MDCGVSSGGRVEALVAGERAGLHSQPLEPAGEKGPVVKTRVAHPNPI